MAAPAGKVKALLSSGPLESWRMKPARLTSVSPVLLKDTHAVLALASVGRTLVGDRGELERLCGCRSLQ